MSSTNNYWSDRYV